MLDPTQYQDWQIAQEAEKGLPPVSYFQEQLGLLLSLIHILAGQKGCFYISLACPPYPALPRAGTNPSCQNGHRQPYPDK